ncbi:hypothetical protein [Bradyrhizobium sp.]|jgi:hypothetical protein|uniref:hypothetical protein n=1 Tax=Bradyrhizobium sp. TaxID=376 RepID=UPI003C1D9781
MIEIGIISIIVLAVGYWVTLWLMSRHDDVLHGDFVHGEPGAETAAQPDQRFAARPPFPAKPVFPAKPEVKAAAVKSAMVKPAAAKPVLRKRFTRSRHRRPPLPIDWIRCNRCWRPSSGT